MDPLTIALHAAIAVALVGGMLALPALLGERHRERTTAEPYESGVLPAQPRRGRTTPGFYVVALLFVIFDLEAAFIVAWAIAARDAGWSGYVGLLVFVALLGVGLLYEWRQGALNSAAGMSPVDPSGMER